MKNLFKRNLNNFKNRKEVSQPPKGETLGIVLKTMFLCLIVAVSAGVALFGWWVHGVLAETPELDPDLMIPSVSTFIFDEDGYQVAEFGTERREWVQFDDISPVMVDAMLAIEDARFFEHYGVDWTRTIAAVRHTLTSMVTGAESTQGGSTLTQQLINQTHLLLEDGERDTTIDRKLQEIYLSIRLEREFSKEQIIEAYLNIAPFGGRIFGIQAASEFYFGVDASQLTLPQAATLAGIVQLPNVHRPDLNAHHTQERREMVLNLMVRHGFISEEMQLLASAEPITDLLIYDEAGLDDKQRYQPFIDRVLYEANARFGINPMAGYQIHTTLNRDIQGYVWDLMTTTEHFDWHNEQLLTVVAMVENDGRIRALAGRDVHDAFNTGSDARAFNLPADGIRQPGSSVKPIWSYGPAIEHLGWGTGTMINDELFAFGGGIDNPLGTGPIVRNWDQNYRGRVSVRNAMDWSWNVPAIKAMNLVGEEKVMEFIASLGIPPYEYVPYGENEPVPTLMEAHALGTQPISALQMAGAYTAFANGGYFIEPFTITRIIAPDGTILYGEDEPVRVMSEATAYMVTSTLRTVITQGTATRIHHQLPDQWLAGKTGTTNFTEDIFEQFNMPSGVVPEVWFVGYSTDFTLAIWTGHPSRNDGSFVSAHEQTIPRDIFAIIMGELNTAGSREPARPSTVVEREIEWQSGTADGEVCFPSGSTPHSTVPNPFILTSKNWRQTELFHEDDLPTCTSDRFTGSVGGPVPEAPTNFSVDFSGGTTLNFSWDHSANRIVGGTISLSYSEASAARDRARSLTANQSTITDELRNLPVGEAEAQMMMDQISAGGRSGGGGTEYIVMGILANGSPREIVRTASNSASHSFSAGDLNAIRSFHVVARSSSGSSGPSNSEENGNFVEPPPETEPDYILIPNMTGWTLDQFAQWADNNNVFRDFAWEYSATIPKYHIIVTNPTGTMRSDQLLIVVVSDGPGEQAAPQETIPETSPEVVPTDPPPTDPPPTDPPPTELDPDLDPYEDLESAGIDRSMLELNEEPQEVEPAPFDQSPGLEDVIHIGNFKYSEEGIFHRFFATIERVNRGDPV